MRQSVLIHSYKYTIDVPPTIQSRQRAMVFKLIDCFGLWIKLENGGAPMKIYAPTHWLTAGAWKRLKSRIHAWAWQTSAEMSVDRLAGRPGRPVNLSKGKKVGTLDNQYTCSVTNISDNHGLWWPMSVCVFPSRFQSWGSIFYYVPYVIISYILINRGFNFCLVLFCAQFN